MQYVLLIYAAESRYAAMTPEETGALMDAYGAYTKDLVSNARAGDAAALEGTHTATSVRVREGKRSVKDGPFAETREQLGGYYVVDAETEADAIAWGAKIPDAKAGTIEVRPVMSTGAPPLPKCEKPLDPKQNKEYLLLIYSAESDWQKMSPETAGKMFADYRAVTAKMNAEGHYVAGAPLDYTAKAKSVHVDAAGKRVVRDGPFAETREQLGGYYRVLAKDLDEAIALAESLPGSTIGTIEVRPVMDTSAYD